MFYDCKSWLFLLRAEMLPTTDSQHKYDKSFRVQNFGLDSKTHIDATRTLHTVIHLPVATAIRQTSVQGAIPATVRITNTCKAHLVTVALVYRQLNDCVVCTQIQVRCLHTIFHPACIGQQ